MEKRMVNKENIMQFDKEGRHGGGSQIPKKGGGSKMTFDKDRVLTPFTAHRAEVGSCGFFGGSVQGIEIAVEKDKFYKLVEVKEEAYLPFRNEWGQRHEYFLPAPYEYMQARWVEEVGLKVGDKVRVVREWERGERGFDIRPLDWDFSGATFEVSHIWSWSIQCEFKGFWELPYFALEKVTEEYRPFANAEEFKPYRDEWFSWTGGFEEEAYRVTAYGDDYVELGGERISYKQFCEQWRSTTSGEPAGVKL